MCTINEKKYGSSADTIDIDLDKSGMNWQENMLQGKLVIQSSELITMFGNRWTENRIQELNQENRRQQAAAQAADAQRRQAAAYLIGSGALNRPFTMPLTYQPVPVRPAVPPIPRPITTNFNNMGNNTNCTTF